MSSPSSASVKHISSVIQHTVELNIDTEIKDLPSESWCQIIANDAGIVRRSPSIEEIKFYLPDLKSAYTMHYWFLDHKPSNRDGQSPPKALVWQSRSLNIVLDKVEFVKAKWDLKFSGRNGQGLLKGKTILAGAKGCSDQDNSNNHSLDLPWCSDYQTKATNLKITKDKSRLKIVILLLNDVGWDELETIDNVKGTVTLTFEPFISKTQALKGCLTQDLNYSKLTKEDEDFTIMCKDKPFYFNRMYLSMISPVFERMQGESYIESHHKVLKVEDFEPETIQSFKNIIYSKNIDQKDLTPQVLMFADKYDIQPLYKICHRYIMETFSKENYLDRINECQLLNDNQAILTKAAEFIKENLGNFEESAELMEFMEVNPKCWIKITQLMMLKK